MRQRHAIQVLRKAEHTQQEVAALLGVSERSVRRVAREDAVVSIDDAVARKERRIGRPSVAEPFRAAVTAILAKDPELLTIEVLRRVTLDGYRGGKTALFTLVQQVRPRDARPLVRFEGLPGEFTQHDFGHVDVRFIDGSRRRVHFFASRLKYSRWVEVTLVPDEQTETLVRTLVAHFARMGGVPLLAVFDRPKTIVLTSQKDGGVIEWNPTFGQVMLELGIGAEVCWPRRGQEKGAVENLVGWVKGSFFKCRRFIDDADLHQQLADWHVEANTKRPNRATNAIPETLMADERPRLRKLRVVPESLLLRLPIFVGPTGFVLHDTRRYSMPPEAIGIAGTLYLGEKRVRIVAGRFEATHERLTEPHTKSTLAEHRTALVAAVSGRRGKLYLKRQQLLELGAVAFAYLTELVHRRPRAWNGEVERLHELLTTYGPEATLASMERALAARTFGSEYVAHHVHDGVVALATALQPTEVPQ